MKSWILAAGLLVALPATASDRFTFEFTELSDGVWAGVRENSPQFPVMGSTTFVISEEGVVVFDGGGSALMSERLIAKIRSLTELPVTHVVISHWHGDHNFGVYRFAEDYPGAQFVAHRFTQQAMLGPKMNYIESNPALVPQLVGRITKSLETGLSRSGEPLTDVDRAESQRLLDDADSIHAEYQRLRITTADLSFERALRIHSGSRTIELLHLGDGNTAGDVVMWLPAEKIVATGDIVVHPTPYGFNVPPRRWADTMEHIQALGYEILVPGHGDIQRDHAFVDLLIECARSVADQADALVAKGVPQAEAEAMIDFSKFEQRFTRGNPLWRNSWETWFVEPMRKAAFKALTGKPMVDIYVD